MCFQNILAPTKAAVRKLLTELFSDEELKNVTVKGTGKSKKAIPEHVLMAMYRKLFLVKLLCDTFAKVNNLIHHYCCFRVHR